MAIRSDIRTLARVHADQDASDFPTDAQYDLLLNQAGRRVWVDLFRAGWPIDFSTATFSSTGATTYTPAGLTAGITAIHGVYFVQSGERYDLKRVNEGMRAQLLSQTGFTGYSQFYDIRVSVTQGIVIELLPRSTGLIYSVDYIPSWPGFSSDATIWPGPIGSEDLVALQAAIYAVRKEGDSRANEANMLKSEYKEQLEIVTDMASWVNLRHPAVIRDVTSVQSRMPFDYQIERF